MIDLSVRSNIKELERYLTRVQRRQLPFATSQALNGTIFAVRRRIVGRTFGEAFKIRNKRFPSAAMRVKKATKKRLEATLFDRLGRDYLQRHTTGGTKRPFTGRRLAVPTRKVKRTGTGKVPRSLQPTTLRNKPNVFVGRFKRPEAGLWRRTKAGVQLLYTMPQTARIDRSFRFYEDATGVVNRQFNRRFFVALKRALRTAR
ncbi:hypothetical protein [Pelagibius sp.]|uniref:hypothetical protein n=1 Tax=Pelagibius sp. TaxID=1931238 RepID=UPI0026160067|nr:hypothetical protein [Pelagibius sp.]